MFTPASGRISSEPCNESDDWTLGTGQVLDGTLRLSPTITSVIGKTLILPELDTPDYETTVPSNSLWSDWTPHDRGTVWYGSSVYLYSLYDNSKGYTDRSIEGGLFWNSALGSGTIPDNIDNATGWTLDTRAVSWGGRLRIIITDGTYRLEFCVSPEGLFRADNVDKPWEKPENALCPLKPWESKHGITVSSDGSISATSIVPFKFPEYITIRISLQGTSLRIKTTEHDLVYDDYPGCISSVSGTGVYYSLINEWHYDNKMNAGMCFITDVKFWENPYLERTLQSISSKILYSNVIQTAYSPIFQPSDVQKFSYAVYDVDNHTGDGTTAITPQYRSGVGGWNDGVEQEISEEQVSQTLGYIGYDQIRFKITQISTDGTQDSPRINKITVASTATDEGVYSIRPGFGSELGDNTVAFDIIHSPTNIYYSTGDTLFVQPNTGGPVDEAVGAALVTEGVVRDNAEYTELGRITGEVSLLGYDFMQAQSDAAGFANGVVSVSGAAGYVENRRHPGTYDTEPMQKVDAVGGQGIQFTTVTDLVEDQRYVLEFPLWVISGTVQASTNNGMLAELRPDHSRLMRIGFRSTGVSMGLLFTALKTSQFYVGRPRLYEAAGGRVDCGVVSDANEAAKYSVSANFYLHAYPNLFTPVMANTPANDNARGFGLGVDAHGSPYLKVGSGAFTGDYLFDLYRWNSIQAKVDTLAGEARLFANGEYVGKRDISGDTTDLSTGNFYIGPHDADDDSFFPGSISQARHTTEFVSDYNVSYRLARKTAPKFKCQYEPELDDQTLVYMTFNQSYGLIENLGSLENPIIPIDNRKWVRRGVSGVQGQGVRFTPLNTIDKYGTMYIEDNMSWVNESFAIEGYLRAPTRYTDQTIMSVGGTGDYGFQVEVDTDGYLVYHFSGDSGEVTIRSDQVQDWKIASGGYQFWHWGIKHNRTTDAIGMWIGGEHIAGQDSGNLGDVSGSTKLYLGSENGTGQPVFGDMDNIKVWTGDIDAYSWAYPPNNVKWTPEEAVYVDDNELHEDRVEHTSPERKLVVMPGHYPGYVDTKVVGSTFYGLYPYKYTLDYHIVLDTGEVELSFGSTRSPFRIMNKVPDHGVPIALIGTQMLSVDTHMSKTELSDREPANRTGYGSDLSVLRNGVTDTFKFLDSVDTNEILVTNRSARWKDLMSPHPLYFKYLVGRNRYYVSVPNAQDVDDIEVIRQAVRLTSNTGTNKQVVWDIIASSTDYYGDTLPDGVFSIVLLLEQIPSSTTWVEYLASDVSVGFQDVGVRKEIINPVPLFGNHSGRMGISLDNNAVGSYNVTVTP